MTDDNKKRKKPALAGERPELPEWFAWAALAAMFLLPFPALSAAFGGDWLASNMSPGEWLLLPLGVISLTMGLLTLGRIPERTLLPLWMAAAAPGALWIAAETLAMFKNGMGRTGGDLLIAWTTRLLFPTLVFLPLLADAVWRDRLYWALGGGLAANLVSVVVDSLANPDAALASLRSGFLYSHAEYALYLAVALPLLAGWRGGAAKRNPALLMIVCMFLLPALAMTTIFSGGLLLAAAAGLAAAWAAWRGHAWILGIFLCLAVMGYGAEGRSERDRAQRAVLAASMSPVNAKGGLSTRLASFDAALAVFVERPFLGLGTDAFHLDRGDPAGTARGDGVDAAPWYATVLGSSGLVGLLVWIAVLAELIGRAVGRKGKSCANAGGVAGATLAIAAAGLWTGILAPGAGALVGFVLAASILDEPEEDATPRQRRRLASDSIVMRRTRIMERVSGKKSERLDPPTE